MYTGHLFSIFYMVSFIIVKGQYLSLEDVFQLKLRVANVYEIAEAYNNKQRIEMLKSVFTALVMEQMMFIVC